MRLILLLREKCYTKEQRVSGSCPLITIGTSSDVEVVVDVEGAGDATTTVVDAIKEAVITFALPVALAVVVVVSMRVAVPVYIHVSLGWSSESELTLPET